MKKRIPTIILLAVFLLGFCILMYPTFSNYWNMRTQSRAIAGYDAMLTELGEADYTAIWNAAEAFNARIAEKKILMPLSDEEMEEYRALIDPIGTGMMGYVLVDKINVRLPLYHTVDDAVLQIAAGHLPETSLPTGGKGNHIAISGHRGLPSAELFTDLDRLETGDTFVLKILDRTLTYQIDQIRIVLPDEVDDLAIDPDEDYCTLITCTPYGINSHRMLLRGVRVANAAEALLTDVKSEAVEISHLTVAVGIAVPILVILLIVLLITTSPRKNQRAAGRKDHADHH